MRRQWTNPKVWARTERGGYQQQQFNSSLLSRPSWHCQIQCDTDHYRGDRSTCAGTTTLYPIFDHHHHHHRIVSNFIQAVEIVISITSLHQFPNSVKGCPRWICRPMITMIHHHQQQQQQQQPTMWILTLLMLLLIWYKNGKNCIRVVVVVAAAAKSTRSCTCVPER